MSGLVSVANQAIPSSCVAVTPNDTTVVSFTALYIGNAGDVSVLFKDDSVAVVHANVPNGGKIVGHIVKVLDTDTDATGILGYSSNTSS